VNDQELWIKRHDEFHEYLNQWSNRPRLQWEIRQLRSAVQPYFRMFLMARGHPEVGVTEHRVIVDAIKRGDVKVAEGTMRRHVLSAAAGVVDFLRSRVKALEE
jgi:DNA-binding GntR family transcriptional regulator